MSADLITPALNLGVAGFAILVLWWMYQSAAKERERNDARLDMDRQRHYERMEKKDKEFSILNDKVRDEISLQLATSTSALHENSRVMERVVDKLALLQVK